jgi:Cytochrome b subunit of the bc complex
VIFAAVVFFAPDGGGLILEPPNFTPADPLVTPAHITPSWYLGAFYAMLRSVPAFWGTQIWGVLVMGAAILVLFFLPWLDRSPVKSIRYKGWIFRVAVTLFVISFITLDFLGMQEPTELHTAIARVCTVLYFLFFLLMPWYSRLDRTRPVPDRIPE